MSTPTQIANRTVENGQARPLRTSATLASSLQLTRLPSTTPLLVVERTPLPTETASRLPPLVLPITTTVVRLPTTVARLPRSSPTSRPVSRTRPSSSTLATATTARQSTTRTVLPSVTARPSSSRIGSSIVQPTSTTRPSTTLFPTSANDTPTTAPTSSAAFPTTTSVESASLPASTSTASVLEATTTTTTTTTATTATESGSSSPDPEPTASSTRTFVLRSIDSTSPSPTRTLKSVAGRRTPVYRQSNSSSLAGGSSPPGAKFEQLTDDGDVTCEVQDTNSVLSFVAILLVIFGLAVCGHFFWRTLKEWMVFRDQQNGCETNPPKSPLPAPVSLSLSPRTRRQGSIFKGSDPDSDMDSDADTIVDDSELPPEIQAKHAKLRASLHGSMSATELHRRPSTRSNSSSSSTNSSTASRVLNVPTLLLVAWSLYLLDQLLYATLLAMLYWVCPEYNCWSRTPLLAPNCPTMPELYTAYVAIQPVVSGVFVTAVMLMFMRIFSLLSPRRSRALQLGCIIILLVTLARLITLTASQYVRRAPESWPPGSPTEVYVWTWYSRTALAGSLLNAVLVKLALMMGLGYISSVRADVCALRQSVLSLTVPPGASIMISPTPCNGGVGCRPSTQSPCRSSAAAGGMHATLLATAAKCESIERRAVRARRWIVTGIIVISGVVLVNLHQKFAHEGMPVQVCNAMFTTMQVGFAACVSMAMAAILELISGR